MRNAIGDIQEFNKGGKCLASNVDNVGKTRLTLYCLEIGCFGTRCGGYVVVAANLTDRNV